MAKKTNVKKQKKEVLPTLYEETLHHSYELLKEDKELQMYLRMREKLDAFANLQEVIFQKEQPTPSTQEKLKESPTEPEVEEEETEEEETEEVEEKEEETPTEDQEEEDLESE